MDKQYDVVIMGGGLAGLCLARQLLLYTDKTVLVLDREAELPIVRQKVGESNVQVQGHYLAKVLDMEEHLFHEQVMKYNLRFMWKSGGSEGRNFEDYAHSYIRQFSNIPCYQLDRNKFEAELIRLNNDNPRHRLIVNVKNLDVEIQTGGGHQVRFELDGESVETEAEWLVDTSGRMRNLSKRLGNRRESEIKHSASFFWTEGTVNIEKLTDASLSEIRKRPERASLGHLPFWLATNHFMGEGFWFWVIPLHDRTSFGLVYDNKLVDAKEVSTKDKLLAWLFKQFPLFERELANQEIVDFQILRNYSHDCDRTIHKDKWAMSGFAGRFTDPLYSPGGDAIAIYNTLITDAITTEAEKKLAPKLTIYETMMNTVYQSFVPSFQHSYNALGDQEAFSMKYVWELSIYFGYYVFPFINDLYTDRLFLVGYLRRFSQLGGVNRSLLIFISEYYEWKKDNVPAQETPLFFEFKDVETLVKAESTFYKVGLETKEALEVLDEQLESLRELARFYVAHVSSVICGNPDLVHSSDHVAMIDLAEIRFEPDKIKAKWDGVSPSMDRHQWGINANVFNSNFHNQVLPELAPA